MIPAWVDGILRPVEKLEAHRRGLRHKAVSVFIVRDGQTLLQKRAAGKYHTPGLWSNACCTHPAWGEAADACARRRVREELGLELDMLSHRGRAVYRADVGGGLVEFEEVEMLVADLRGGVAASPDATEVAATRWIDFEDLDREIAEEPDAFTPWLRIYLEEYRGLVLAEQ
jgi:isopentenyl-diphosphate delta-isomerase